LPESAKKENDEIKIDKRLQGPAGGARGGIHDFCKEQKVRDASNDIAQKRARKR